MTSMVMLKTCTKYVVTIHDGKIQSVNDSKLKYNKIHTCMKGVQTNVIIYKS